MAAWTFEDIPDQTDRRAIVTGANTGIGFETARALARKGAHVTLACRSPEKGGDAVRRIQDEGPAGAAEFQPLDLADLESVGVFAADYAATHERLDLLILNAGVMVPPESSTAQGFELQFGVNHLAHFALTGRLLPLMQRTPGARVVAVSSTAATMGTMNFDDLDFHEGYKAWPAYGQSKLANQLFTLELQRRLRATGSSVVATAAHPGWTATDLQRTATLFRWLNPLIAMKPPEGALPTLRAATDPGAGGGDYFGPSGLMQMRGSPVKIEMTQKALDERDAARLWEISEQRTEMQYAF